jgi:hypothetical protein
MPTFDWQLIVALLAVAAAASFLARRAVSLLQSGGKAGGVCGSCGSCSTALKSSTDSSTSFIPLESLALKSVDGAGTSGQTARHAEKN